LNSALYEGTVRHRRLSGPVHDELRQSLFMAYLDLDELPGLLDGHPLLCSARRPALARFRRADHLGDPDLDLAEAVRELVAARTGTRPEGPVRLLTHLRCFGHCFNPVSFYYCFAPDGRRLQAAIAHVTNTPWGESHSYVIPADGAADHGSTAVLHASMAKRLHVSPLMSMGHAYDVRLSQPGERLSVHITSSTLEHPQQVFFDATLSLAKRDWSAGALRVLLARYPLQTVRILTRIYGHALSLRLRGATYHPHPGPGAIAP
jgi:DUF1365 family protein